MKSFKGKLAVVTGAGSGMGRTLALQLVQDGCHVAICDFQSETLERARVQCEEEAPAGVRVSAHLCDVSDETQVLAFRDEVARAHATDCVQLLFNNAGIAGGQSFVTDSRAEWDRVFEVCWGGVYYMTRAFLPMLIASKEARLINTSSINGFWASLGPHTPQSAYASAKFAVKGFSEGLIQDLRLNAPHVHVHLVMPGHVGTSIAQNVFRVHGKSLPEDMSSDDLLSIREGLQRASVDVSFMSDDDLRGAIRKRVNDFQDEAPLSAKQASELILEGVREERWRILIGADAKALDSAVRQHPDDSYEPDFVAGFIDGFDAWLAKKAEADGVKEGEG